MDKKFFERKIRELEDDKLIALLSLKNSEHLEFILLVKEEAERRSLRIELNSQVEVSPIIHLDLGIEESNKLDKWSWGAFLLALVWIPANRLSIWWLLVIFIPFVNIAAVFYLGFNGIKLAYSKSDIRLVEDFITVQKEWNKWGVRFFWIAIIAALIFEIISAILH